MPIVNNSVTMTKIMSNSTEMTKVNYNQIVVFGQESWSVNNLYIVQVGSFQGTIQAGLTSAGSNSFQGFNNRPRPYIIISNNSPVNKTVYLDVLEVVNEHVFIDSLTQSSSEVVFSNMKVLIEARDSANPDIWYNVSNTSAVSAGSSLEIPFQTGGSANTFRMTLDFPFAQSSNQEADTFFYNVRFAGARV